MSDAPSQPTRPWQLKLVFVWGGELFSLLTSSVLQMGLIWHLTVSTGSAAVLSLASLAGFLPMAFIGAFAGVVVDRLGVKPVLIGSDLCIAAVSAALALASLAGPLPVWLVVVALFVRSLGSSFYTPASSALTPLVAPPQHLTRLAGIQQSAQSLGYIAGTAIAAVIYPLFGLTAMIALDVAGALLATLAIVLSRIETPGPASQEAHAPDSPQPASLREAAQGVLGESLEGYRTIRSHKGLFALLWCGFAFTLAYAPISALFPVIVMGHFGGGTTEAAVVEIVFAVGMILGGTLLGVTGGFKNRAVSIVGATVAYGIACAVAGLLGPGGLLGYMACTLLMGLSSPWYSGPQIALMQEKIPPEYMGRVFGLFTSISAWAMPVGLVFSAMFADTVGAPMWFFGSGIVMLALAAVTWAIPAIRKVEQE